MKSIGERMAQALWWLWVVLMLLVIGMTWSGIGITGPFLAGPIFGVPIWIIQRPLAGYWSVARLFS